MKQLCLFSLLSLALAGFSFPGYSQAIEPGVYNTEKRDYPITLKFAENGNLIYKDYRETVEYTKVNDSKYVHSKYPQLYIAAGESARIVQAEENSAYRKEFVLYSPANATPAPGVISFVVNEDKYYAVKSDDSKFTGLYKYPGKEPRFFKYEQGEPVVELNADQSGFYQRHGTPATPIKWWIESDYKGNFQVINGALADRYFLVVQFGPGGKYDKEGTYQRMNLDIYKDGSKAVIMGERVKEFN